MTEVLSTIEFQQVLVVLGLRQSETHFVETH
jgi:hypothetical protein